jgi:hypothetical protein
MKKNGNSGALPSNIDKNITWINKTTNNLTFGKEVDGHHQSTVFDHEAPKSIETDTLDPPVGYNNAPQNKGTPALKVQMEYYRRLKTT